MMYFRRKASPQLCAEMQDASSYLVLFFPPRKKIIPWPEEVAAVRFFHHQLCVMSVRQSLESHRASRFEKPRCNQILNLRCTDAVWGDGRVHGNLTLR